MTGWDTDKAVHGVTYKLDGQGAVIAGSQLDFKGVVSGNTITNFTVTGGIDAGNAVGDIVQATPTAAWAKDLADGILTSLDDDGTLKAGAVDNAAALASNVVTTAKILDSNVTTPKIADGAITYAKLLSTIFSGEVDSQANAGTAGGTIYYANIGGIKLAWGESASITVNAVVIQKTFTLPTDFFSTIQYFSATATNFSSGQLMTASAQTCSTTTLTANIWNTAASTAYSGRISFLIIGT